MGSARCHYVGVPKEIVVIFNGVAKKGIKAMLKTINEKKGKVFIEFIKTKRWDI